MRRKLKTIALVIFAFILLERFTYFTTGGFSPTKIKAENWISYEEKEISDEANEILKQRFFYLSKGVQFYVFVSEDGKSVLKFVKYRHARPTDWLAEFTGNHSRQSKRLSKIFESCRIAYRYLKDETGLIAYQLNNNTAEKKPLLLVDNLGIAHTIDLNKTSFVLQKRAIDFFEGAKGKEKQAVDEILSLIKKRQANHISNGDSRLRNFGFIDDKLIEIDLGSYTQKEALELQELLNLETLELKTWLDENNQSLSNYLTQKINEN